MPLNYGILLGIIIVRYNNLEQNPTSVRTSNIDLVKEQKKNLQ